VLLIAAVLVVTGVGVGADASAEVASQQGWSIDTFAATSVHGELAAVACAAADSCWAVGNRILATGTAANLGAYWNGVRWSHETLPSPTSPNVTGLADPLGGISCSSAAACTAVGDDLVLRWGGRSWTLQRASFPHAGHQVGVIDAGLQAVSCPSLTRCVAVGNQGGDVFSGGGVVDVGPRRALVLVWSGNRWSEVPVPAPAGARASAMWSVSCGNEDSCMAVGDYERRTNGAYAALAEDWNGSRWQREAVPVGATSKSSYLLGVSCPSARDCETIGNITSRWGGTTTLIAVWNGATWQRQAAPAVGAFPGMVPDAISCSETSACTALLTPASNRDSVIETWDGRRWAAQPAPMPPGAQIVSLGDLSCTAPRSCLAVGLSSRSEGLSAASVLVERESP
jgi:hypothetical protein